LLHLPPEHVPPLQSEFELQWPQLLFEQVPLPLQSEFELQPPHLPFEQVPLAQSEFELQWLQVPLEHVPWPLQSEFELQWPHVPLEHWPRPPQSELLLHNASPVTCSNVKPTASLEFSAANTGTGTDVVAAWRSPLPQPITQKTIMKQTLFMLRGYPEP
jgi:hypothetical protein